MKSVVNANVLKMLECVEHAKFLCAVKVCCCCGADITIPNGSRQSRDEEISECEANVGPGRAKEHGCLVVYKATLWGNTKEGGIGTHNKVSIEACCFCCIVDVNDLRYWHLRTNMIGIVPLFFICPVVDEEKLSPLQCLDCFCVRKNIRPNL